MSLPITPVSLNPVLEARHVGKTVTANEGILTLLEDINLSVMQGESVAIIGPSGSGKSTLLGLLAGLDIPTSGQIELLGVPLQDKNEDQRARLRAGNVGFVFQSFQLLSGLTALENVAVALEVSGNMGGIRQQARVVLQQVGLDSRLNHFPQQLSGGEQQRVACARAFVTHPKILFADEPTGNLDQTTGARLIELIFGLQHQHQTTLILVTHDEALAERCDRKFYLESGRLLST